MFFPFFENLKNISQYNSAYYAAISSVERWALVLRYKSPWFEWTGGFENGNKIWWSPESDNNSDFGVINDASNWMRWNISSRTKNIPNRSGWNVDFMLADVDSANYNMISYTQKENFILDVDNTSNPDQYYNSWGSMKYFSGDYVSGSFRLPPKVFLAFSGWWVDGNLLCDDRNIPSCDLNWNHLFDEAVVNRSLDWNYNMDSFSVIPNWSVNYNYNPASVDFSYDNAIRQSLFDNRVARFDTSLNNYSPVWWLYTKTEHNVIWKDAATIKDIAFGAMFKDGNVKWLIFKFSLLDLLRTRNGSIYPFLEYQFAFPTEVSDRFYTIQWVGKVWDYDIHINVNKPTSNDSSVWEFAIIF